MIQLCCRNLTVVLFAEAVVPAWLARFGPSWSLARSDDATNPLQSVRCWAWPHFLRDGPRPFLSRSNAECRRQYRARRDWRADVGLVLEPALALPMYMDVVRETPILDAWQAGASTKDPRITPPAATPTALPRCVAGRRTLPVATLALMG